MPAPVRRERSPLEAALDRVGDRWSLLIVEALLAGPAAVQRAQRGHAVDRPEHPLRTGCDASNASACSWRRRTSSDPPRMSYALTSIGHDLASALRLLADWGSQRETGAAESESTPLRHELCGTPLEVRWYCPTCGLVVDDPEHDASTTV
jgi:DNA-binding HxlR family transcriptional regulator